MLLSHHTVHIPFLYPFLPFCTTLDIDVNLVQRLHYPPLIV